MKILYLKGYKWLLSQNQRVRNDFFGYRQCEALAKHMKPLNPYENIKLTSRRQKKSMPRLRGSRQNILEHL